jgi:hypothetical protein
MPAKTNKPLKYVLIEKTVIEAWAKNFTFTGLFKQA